MLYFGFCVTFTTAASAIPSRMADFQERTLDMITPQGLLAPGDHWVHGEFSATC